MYYNGARSNCVECFPSNFTFRYGEMLVGVLRTCLSSFPFFLSVEFVAQINTCNTSNRESMNIFPITVKYL